ncbi:RDD family protein [Streptomyces sp. NPDC047000]|uniref:RDD family protein n=1 Tax=Streptomyces sp. NPDC047000 TaxID=3155474 RepID=UPI0033E14D63
MSAPTPAPGDDRPRDGYYPDPSIPGYVRYWNGAAWVPGTSRPAPQDGAPLDPPPGRLPAQAPAPAPGSVPPSASVPGPAAPPVEETGPHFFDEDPQPDPARPAEPQPLLPGQQGPYGSRPEPASAWGADRSRQSGFGGDQDRRVSWGTPSGPDPRVPTVPPAQPEGHAAYTDGTAGIPPAEADGAQGEPGTFVFRRPTAGSGGTAGTGTPGGPGAPPGPAGPGFGAGKAAAARAAAKAQAGQAQPPAQQTGAEPDVQPRQGPQAQPPAPAPGPATPYVPPQQSASVSASPTAPPAAPMAPFTPLTGGAGGGQASWAQQVHQLAGADDGRPVAPWKPPVDDPFLAIVRRQAAIRPAGLGRRLAARLIDSVLLLAVTGAAAVPLGSRALDHVQTKIDEARLSGRTVTVWLLDGTTSACLAAVLGVLLLFGVLYEVLPTARWGRTLGKKLCGLEVRDIEAHEPPGFGASLRRWLVYTVPGLLGIGVVGVAWCLFDRPWHQCWHDKAAHTFVAD